MNEPVEFEPPQEPPPENRAQGCLRILLWFLPTGFAIASIWGLMRVWPLLGADDRMEKAVLLVSFAVNILLTLGVGWFRATLMQEVMSLTGKERRKKYILLVLSFFVFQIFFVIPFFVIPVSLVLGFILGIADST